MATCVEFGFESDWGEIQEEVDSFKYLGSIVSKDRGVVEDVISRANEGRKVSGAMNRIWNVGCLCMDVKRIMIMSERIVVPIVLYGGETWGLNVTEKRRLNKMEIRF